MHAETMTAAVSLKIMRCIADFSMFSSRSSVLAGFSGGADSTALLHWLTGYCSENGLRLAALHLNHKIRGGEAERDAEFCRNFCAGYNIEFFYREADIPALAEASGTGLEETARNARYAAFDEVADEFGFDCIATAHNADDNLETVIFNLARGTSASGLSGIPPVRGRIIRPLLYCDKSELLNYCRENGLSFMTDSTNADSAYTRNYIRSEIIPRLEHVNSAVRRNAVRMCRTLRTDNTALETLAAEHSLCDGREALASLDDALLYRALERNFRDYTGKIALESVHLDKLAELLRSDKASFAYSLPGGVRLTCDRNTIRFECDPRKRVTVAEPFAVRLHEGINALPRGVLVVIRDENDWSKDIKQYKNIYKLSIQAKVRSDKIVGVLSAETPRGVDKIRCRGMSRSVKNLLYERKITHKERENLISVKDNGGTLWIPGIAMRDGCEAETKNIESTLTFIYFYS